MTALPPKLKLPPAPVETPSDSQTSRPWMRAEGRDRFGAWAKLAVGSAELRLRLLPARRTFLMGSVPGEPERQDNENQHQVTLTTAAWIGETEVTRGLWQAVTGRDQPGDPNRPQAGINWYEARDFIATLNQRLPGLAARLPTEAEWEQACRGGSPLAFSAGSQPDNSDWLAQPGKGPRPVAMGRPNRFGLFDVHGNVREWCSDSYDPGKPLPDRTEIDPESRFGTQVVLRGGSCELPAGAARCAARDGADPQDRPLDVGFRILVPEL